MIGIWNKIDKNNLCKILHSIGVQYDQVLSIEKLGGLTNNNYKLILADNELVIRIPGENTKDFIDRINEKINSKIAESIGLDSKCIYFNEFTGIKISKYITNAETLDENTGKQKDNIVLMAKNLKLLHSSDNKFLTTFNPFHTIDIYEKELLRINGKIAEDYYDMKCVFIKFKDILKNMNIKYTPCHIDPLPQNFIKDDKEKLYLIDWEYSGNYDPLWDLSAVILECGFSAEQEEFLLSKYFNRIPTNQERLRIHIHKIMQDVFWFLWSATKIAKGETDMKEFSLNKYESAKFNICEYLNLENELYASI